MRIMHVFRAPVGGLFRHVRELAAEQARRGHDVGLICDSRTGGDAATEQLAALAPILTLGVHRLDIPRLPHPKDIAGLLRARAILEKASPHIVHGHGAKGGLLARLAAKRGKTRAVYTAHGGSLHFSWRSPTGAAFLAAERLMLLRTDGLIFVCDFERRAFKERVGRFSCPHAVVHNGLPDADFSPVTPAENAADVVFVGELRRLKGVDILIEALARLHARGRPLRAVIVGDGPDATAFRDQAQNAGLAESVSFPGAMPAREAFTLGRVVVVPSRAESFPYIVLEAQAAARPVIATRVGGIPEMLPEEALVPPEDPDALARKIAETRDDPEVENRAGARREAVRERFSIAAMTEGILAFYARLIT